MKLFLFVLCILSTVPMVTSCGKHHDPASDHSKEDHKSHQAAPQGLELNNGKKWQMDTHTRDSFVRMVNIADDVDLTVTDYQGLKTFGSNLLNELDLLIKGCTMTGDAHDQLHVYLTGYIPAVQALAKSGRLADAKDVIYYLKLYGDYME